jgi:alkylation response protein AidB-like acyl-CoA dehydrogenase
MGGFGGSALLRAAVYDQLWAGGYPVPELVLPVETLAPALIRYAPTLAAVYLPRYLRGEELWSQGFSEPDAGSDLAALRCRARPTGSGFVISGQKTWTTLGHLATRCFLLARTGAADSRHRGLTMFLVDVPSPGLEIRPLRYANGRAEYAEMFFDDVAVPAERMIGAEGEGWAVSMYLLQFERGMYAWNRQGLLHLRLAELAELASASTQPGVTSVLGSAWLAVAALRARCRQTVGRLAAGENPGPEISVDKVLLATAEQAVSDAFRTILGGRFELGDDADVRRWRSEWLYTRAASIYGGSAEVQRTILADRVLGLPKEGA